jgi:hypothetical protein
MITRSANGSEPCVNAGELGDLCQRAESMLAELSESFPDIAANFDVDTVAERVSSEWKLRGYSDVPGSILTTWEQIHRQCGKDAVGQFNRMLLCKLIATSRERLAKAGLPPIIIREYAAGFDRVLNKSNERPNPYSDPFDDIFLKDLGISSQTMIPAGYYVMDITNGIARSLFFSGGLRQFLKLFWLYVVRYKRKGPFLFTHYHGDHKTKFTPEGRKEAFSIIAELLTKRTEVKAMVGAAWYYDPAMRSISPHLSYLRDLPEANGAQFFRGRPKFHPGALNSRTRRRLYEEGKYVPRPCTMVWPREELITWADDFQLQTGDPAKGGYLLAKDSSRVDVQ